jgi:hypothetical protein
MKTLTKVGVFFIHTIIKGDCMCKDSKKKRKVLFIIKERYTYGQITKAYGLYNSCDFISRKLNEIGIESKVVQVVDNNCIDREVSIFKPTDVFIEALWVVPDKFKILSKLHPKVKWHIRLHSKTPFIATESITFSWLNQYINLKCQGIDIELTANSQEFCNNLMQVYNHHISYTPNIYYPSDKIGCNVPNLRLNDNEIHIGIFGALRPLKNHLQQAIWSLEFARTINKKAVVHINVSEHESYASSHGVGNILTNIRNLFNSPGCNGRLVEHPWYPHDDFLGIVKQMDLGMQVSFSETFNITAADFVYVNVPIVVSSEIPFINPLCKINTNSSEEALNAMKIAITFSKFGLNKINKMLLNKWNEKALKQWNKVLQFKDR